MAKPRHRKKGQSKRQSNYRIEPILRADNKTKTLLTIPLLSAEKFICPRYQLEGGIRLSESDRWEFDTWLNPLGRPNIWFPNCKPPATCSYCGAAAPEDVLRLMRENEWEPAATTKNYKQYLHPPGYYLYHAKLNEFLNKKENMGKTPMLSDELGEFKSPTPPVKIYLQHFTTDQMNEFNRLVREMMAALPSKI